MKTAGSRHIAPNRRRSRLRDRPVREPTCARFEVATLKQSPPPQGDLISITLGAIKGDRFYMTNVTLNDCVKFAYDLVSDDQISGPDWIRSKALLYDIVAVVPPNTSHEQVVQMTQTLLADRLKLVVHREQRDMKYLALVPGKGAPKMPSQTLRRNGTIARASATLLAIAWRWEGLRCSSHAWNVRLWSIGPA